MFRQKSAAVCSVFAVRVIDSDRIGVRKIRAERRDIDSQQSRRQTKHSFFPSLSRMPVMKCSPAPE